MSVSSYHKKGIHALILAVIGGASLLTSCSMEAPVIPAEEIYTREFIKTFGVIDASHDFNMASRATLTVTSASPADVKVYADVSGTRYLFGTFLNVSGTREISVDVPQGTSSLIVKSGSRTYTTAPGSQINLDAPASRELNEGTHSYGDVNVTITELTGDHGFLTLTEETMKSYETVLPESDKQYVTQVEETNLNKVWQNFVAEASQFWIFPEYWNTNSYSKNEIGVYYKVDGPANEYNNIVEVTDFRDNSTVYLQLVPIFNGQISQLKHGSATPVWEKVNGMPSIDIDDAYTLLSCLDPEEIDIEFKIYAGDDVYFDNGSYEWDASSYATIGESILVRKKETTKWYLFYAADWCVGNFNIWKQYLPVIYPHSYRFDEDGNLQKNTVTYSGIYEIDAISAIDFDTEDVRSYGVHVQFSEKIEFGFYIHNTNGTMPTPVYSESFYNDAVVLDGESVNPSYVATFEQGTDTEGNVLRHLCFEDWYKDNFDLNDMVFRVYGFDKLRSGLNTDIGTLINEDSYDDGDDDEDDSEDKPFKWIIACEDLGTTDDFDFNDIVFAVSNPYPTSSDDGTEQTKVDVTALAAGGTLEAYILYNGKKVGDEIHKWFGYDQVTTMINTSGGTYITGATKTITVSSDFTLTGTSVTDGKMGGFSIMVVTADGTSYEIVPPTPFVENGTVSTPQMLCLPGTWVWPLERHRIDFAYPAFKDWVNSKDVDWTDPDSGNSDHIYQGYKPSSSSTN